MKINSLNAWLKFSNFYTHFCIGHTTKKPEIQQKEVQIKPQISSNSKTHSVPEKETEKTSSYKSNSSGITSIINTIKQDIKDFNTLDELFTYIKHFPYCPLKNFAQNTVLFDGNKDAKIMLVGEAPGEDEDTNGIPFCGRSGKLLDNIFNVFNLDRTKLYITNVLPWRPPANRKPTQDEIKMFRPILEKHISLVNPSLIIAIGSSAMTCLLDDKNKISENTGQVFEYQNEFLKIPKKLTVIYHPSFLLRSYKMKKKAWLDVINIQKETSLF